MQGLAMMGRQWILAVLVAVTLLSGSRIVGQSYQGGWSDTFDHATTAPQATDYTAPFRGTGYMPPPPTGPYSWGYYDSGGGRFQPVHMALIPKGPHQGKVVVWDEWPVVLRANTALDSANRCWSCQSWAIIDPEPVLPRFRNFLLPSVGFLPSTGTDVSAVPLGSIVCAGHAWSQEGDLVVAGGEQGEVDATVFPPLISNFHVARYLMLFDPSAPSQSFLSAPSLYPGEVGCWQAAPNLQLLVGRWYPTVVLSQRLTRNGLNNEVVMVSGGADFATTDHALNSYETFVVRAHGSPAGFLTRDPDHGSPVQILPGPGGTTNTTAREILGLYPRTHLLSNGQMFVSGYAPDSSKVDLDAPLAARNWGLTTGRTGSVWSDQRENGGSVFFAWLARGTLQDVVMRLGGVNNAGVPTDDAEICLAGNAGAPWLTLPTIPGSPPGSVGRTDLNAVVLPDATVFVVGGTAMGVTGPVYFPVLTPALFVPGPNTWHLQPVEPTSSPRRYHSTAVLLPDGRVMVGGGNDRTTGQHPDYAIFSPHYLQGNPPPQRPRIVKITGPSGALAVDWTDGTYLLDGHDSTGAPVTFGLECTDVRDSTPVAKIVLMAPGSITHHSDMTARYVELPSAATDMARRIFTTLDGNRLPRGYYMMFALDAANIPSKAVWVKIRS